MILTSGDIGNYYDAPPAVILEQATWLGLFANEEKPAQKPRESLLAVTRVSFARRNEPGPSVYRLITDPPGADLLLSGVPQLSPGPVTTLGQFIDFGGETREAEFRLARRHYRIRLDSKEPNYCDAVIVLTPSGRSQKLFDAAVAGVTKNPACGFATPKTRSATRPPCWSSCSRVLACRFSTAAEADSNQW